MGVADHEGDRHGLAQRPAKRQHGAAHHAGAGIRQHHAPCDFPGGAAQSIGRLLQHGRHGLEHIARHRRDERQDHDRKDEAGGEDADAVRRAAQQGADQRNAVSGVDDGLLEMELEPGREHEKTPDAVNDGGDAGQQLDGDADRAAERARAQFGEKNRHPDADRHGHEHGQERGHHGAVNRRQAAEHVGCRVPGVGDQKRKAERLDGGHGTDHQREDDPGKDQQNRQGGRPGEEMKPGIAASGAPGGFRSGGQFGIGSCFGQGDISH